MLRVIRLLPKDVVNQIAAGEIIHEPSSVLKELLENSIDANSTDIEIHILNGGKNLIQVIDNGKGMIREDAVNCYEKHATSKIESFYDLNNLYSMGFRGEALASIAAVCDLEIKTAVSGDDIGTLISLSAGRLTSIEDCICSKGSSFSVKNLFYNLPARRAFLKSDILEYGRLIKEFYKIAISNYAIKFSLFHNNDLVFKLNSDNCKSRIISLFGDKFKQKLLGIDEKIQNLYISGFVENPEGVKKYKSQQYIFVNKRFVYNSELKAAILSAFDGVIVNNYQPSYFIFIDIPPGEIDINIHPQKTEVKFTDLDTVKSLLIATVKRTLGVHYKAPMLDFSMDAAVMDFVPEKKLEPPNLSINKEYNPFSVTSKANNISYDYNENTLESFVTDNSLSDSEDIFLGLQPPQDLYQSNLFYDLEKNNYNEQKNSNGLIKHIVHVKPDYVLAITQEGIYVVNYKRAIRRVLYEEYLTKVSGKRQLSQTLLYNSTYKIPKHNYDILKRNNTILKDLGFIFNLNKNCEVTIEGLPGFLEAISSETNIIVESIIEILSNVEHMCKEVLIELMAKKLARKVCKIKYNTLRDSDIVITIEKLFEYKNSNWSTCEKKNYTYINIDNIINDLNN
ncbi:MAG: DNA mismatch repair endonuclease MutL [Solitalea-like symbiont of Tyrophagus putrescentiae]